MANSDTAALSASSIQVVQAADSTGARTAPAPPREVEGALLDRLLFTLVLLAWAGLLWCWLSHFATSLA